MTKFSEELFDTICSRIASGESLNSICRDQDMPAYSVVMAWVKKRSDLAEKYARARVEMADADADKIADIADRTLSGEYDPAAARVAIDALKWIAAKQRPRVYGDRVTAEITGADGGPVQIVDPTKLSTGALSELVAAMNANPNADED